MHLLVFKITLNVLGLDFGTEHKWQNGFTSIIQALVEQAGHPSIHSIRSLAMNKYSPHHHGISTFCHRYIEDQI